MLCVCVCVCVCVCGGWEEGVAGLWYCKNQGPDFTSDNHQLRNR